MKENDRRKKKPGKSRLKNLGENRNMKILNQFILETRNKLWESKPNLEAPKV